jgi:hypothetical protein
MCQGVDVRVGKTKLRAFRLEGSQFTVTNQPILKALLDGLDDDEAKKRGMVAAIMGAQARQGIRKDHHEEFHAQKEAAEKKKKTTITAESFNKQVAYKMGDFFEKVFLPTLKKLVESGLSYDEVKRVVKIPATWGAKTSGEQFQERVNAYFSK